MTDLKADRVLLRAEIMIQAATAAAERVEREHGSNQSLSANVGDIREVAVCGRSVTFVLQNLRSISRDEFEAWYAPWVAEMQPDPLLRYFNELRTKFLKEGAPDGSGSTFIVLGSVGTLEVGPMNVTDFHIEWEDLRDLPSEHLGRQISPGIATACRLYVTYMERVYLSAKNFVAELEQGPDAT
jgi:hypothetical protein